MEFLEAVSIFFGWNYCVFHYAVDAGIDSRRIFLCYRVFDDYIYNCSENDIRRSGVGMALSCMYNSYDQRGAVFLYRHIRSISCENLYGGKETSYLSGT